MFNLEEFQRLVLATLTVMYPMYAQYASSSNITVERFIEISHLVVRDYSPILSQEPSAFQPPAPSNLMAPTHLLSKPAEMFKTLEFLASKCAQASSRTKQPSADTSAVDARAPTTVVSNAFSTQLPPTPV